MSSDVLFLDMILLHRLLGGSLNSQSNDIALPDSGQKIY